MKHLTFLKTWLLAVALMVVGSGSVWAESESESIACPTGTIVDNTMTFTTDDFTIVHAKGTDANFASYTPWRVYTNNTVTFTAGPNVELITSIVITAGTAAYATDAVGGTLTVANGGGSAIGSASGTTATITMLGTVTEFVLKPKAQTRWSNIVINYKLKDLGCTTATTSFESASVEKSVVDASFTNTFTSNNTSPQSYSSSNTDVAIVNASTGAVVIVDVGTTTISVSQDADDTYCSVLQSYTLTVSPLAAPVATDATNVTGTSFTANWEAVAGATGYELTVSSGVLFLNESFDHLDGTGGNDGGWSGSIAANALNSFGDWVLEKAYSGNNCVKLGTASIQGSITTPELGLNGDAPITFRAGAWSATNEQTELLLEITGGGSLSVSSVEMLKGAFSSYSVNIIGGTATTKITFKGKQAANSRFFLDEVKVGSTTAISGSPFTVTGTSKIITGLTVDTDYYYTVKAIAGSHVSDESNEIKVTTGPLTSLENATANFAIRVNNSKIMFNATAGELIEIYNIAGQKIISQIANDGLNTIPVTNKGVLVVKVGEIIAKVVN